MSTTPLLDLFSTPGGSRVTLRLLILHRQGTKWATAEEVASGMVMSEVRVKHVLQALTEKGLVERQERMNSGKRGPKPFEYRLAGSLAAILGV